VDELGALQNLRLLKYGNNLLFPLG